MKITLTILFLFSLFVSIGQTGGQNSFPFLDLNYNARSAGLGGTFISVKDKDVNLGIENPSLLNLKMNNHLSLSQALYVGGINYGQLGYAHQLGEKGMYSAHIRYVSYGTFNQTLINGEQVGQFKPFEYALGFGYAQQINPRISVGGNINVIGSHLETYQSFGTSLDLSGTYTNDTERLLVTAMVKNGGVQFKAYNEERHALPANFLIATSYKLEHAPIRFSLTAHHLNNWDLTYNDPNAVPTIDPLSGDTIPVPKAGIGEKLARHFNYHLEVLASKNIHARMGFNYHRRQELKLESRPGIAGFSFGLGLYFKRFSLDYGFTAYSRAGQNHMLSLSANIGRIKK